ncbi:MAG: hypothetical protein ACRD8W_14320, partial [Nitrososphaeraceae archaeon]
MTSFSSNTSQKVNNSIAIAFVFISTFLILSMLTSISITIFPAYTADYRVNSVNHHATLSVKAQSILDQVPINSSGAKQIPNYDSSNPPPRLFNLTNLFDKVDQSVVQVTGSSQALGSALGSGFVYDKEGHIVTNYHVISGIGQ